MNQSLEFKLRAPDCLTVIEHLLDGNFDSVFESLHNALTNAHPHPFDWITLLRRPPFWRRAARAAYARQVEIFRAHGFELTDDVADKYRDAPGQLPREDATGAMIRKLRHALWDQYEDSDLRLYWEALINA